MKYHKHCCIEIINDIQYKKWLFNDFYLNRFHHSDTIWILRWAEIDDQLFIRLQRFFACQRNVEPTVSNDYSLNRSPINLKCKQCKNNNF